MASLTSESDSTTFAGDEIKHQLSFIILFSQSHYGHESRLPESTSAYGTTRESFRGAGLVFFFASGCLTIPFRLQVMATLKGGDQWQMWEFIRIT